MKALIIEDEEFAALRLISLLEACHPDVEVVAQLESVVDSIEWFKTHEQPDLVFLDIHLEDGLSFDIFDHVHVSSPIIFTTAYDEYAIKAFKLKSIDYLLKPISKEELCNAIEKFKTWQGAQESVVDYSELIRLLKPQVPAYRERFSVVVGEKLKTVDVNDVAYFFSNSSITFLATFNNRQFALDRSLDKITPELNPKDFFRVNRQFLVNHKAILQTHIYPKSKLKLELKPATDDMVFVSIDKVTAFKQWLDGE
jgi:DNA-binding LytR/AlgR family response regulator